MSITLETPLAKLAYGKPPSVKAEKPHLFMGIGMWSCVRRLSQGLPVDVMHMLLTAAVMRAQISQEIRKEARLIILIADSMALREGAPPGQLERVRMIYIQSLTKLLGILQLAGVSEIVLSSDLERLPQMQKCAEEIATRPVMSAKLASDPVHAGYSVWQSAISLYMHQHRDVGIKVGWIYSDSVGVLRNGGQANHWDELRFDQMLLTVCPELPLQYLYAKAGMNQIKRNKEIQAREDLPYAAFEGDCRYLMHVAGDIKLTCITSKAVVKHWRESATICRMIAPLALPADCFDSNNDATVVYRMLNHWCNLSDKIVAVHHITEYLCEEKTPREWVHSCLKALWEVLHG